MLDIKYVRENLAEVKRKLAKRTNFKFDLEKVLKLDEERRSLLARVEMLRAEQKKASAQKGNITRAKEIKEMLRDLEPQLLDAEENFKIEAVKLPNIPLDDVPEGKSEDDNKVLRTEGEIKLKSGKDHLEIGKTLDLIDIERATKVSGSRFYYLKNEAVELEFALVRYVLDLAKAAGFQPMIPPILINNDMAWGSGHFEAINDDAYHVKQDEMVIVGTSEQSILPYYANEAIADAPQRFIGFSTCLRRESGSHGKDVRGILRVHQFDKLEMFSFCKPEDSEKEHDLIISLEEKIMTGLELPYRVVALCTGDMGMPSAKTIDIETWMPSQGRYRETHSSSNCTDFQARRLNIRYKSEDGNKFVHTLNGTAIATARIIIAILENYQQEDGSVRVPAVLQPYLKFSEIKK